MEKNKKRREVKEKEPMDLVQELEDHIMRLYDEYRELFGKYNMYAGRVIDSQEIEELNKITYKIQEMYIKKLYPIFHYVIKCAHRSQNTIKDYESWMQSFQMSGAVEYKQSDQVSH